MTEADNQVGRPYLGEKALREQEARRAREAAALRENLRRRKAQMRAREAPASPSKDESGKRED